MENKKDKRESNMEAGREIIPNARDEFESNTDPTAIVIEPEKNFNTERKTKRDIIALKTFIHRFELGLSADDKMLDIDMREIDNLVLEKIPAEQLNIYITEFIRTAVKPDGSEYEVSSVRSLFQSFDRYLREKNYKWSIKNSPEFASCRVAKAEKVDKISEVKQSGKVRLNAVRGMNDNEVDAMFDCGVLGLETPQALINTLWWNNCRFLGLRGCREHHNLKWGDFQYVKGDKDGVETNYLHYTGPVSRKTSIQNTSIWPTSGNLCDGRDPISVYLKYSEMRPKAACNEDSPFYLSPNFTMYKGGRCRTSPYDSTSLPDTWFRIMPYGINAFAGLMKGMFRSAGLMMEGEETTKKHQFQNLLPRTAAKVTTSHSIASSSEMRSLLSKQQEYSVYMDVIPSLNQESNEPNEKALRLSTLNPTFTIKGVEHSESEINPLKRNIDDYRFGEIVRIKHEPVGGYTDEDIDNIVIENPHTVESGKSIYQDHNIVTTQLVSFREDSDSNTQFDWQQSGSDVFKTPVKISENTLESSRSKSMDTHLKIFENIKYKTIVHAGENIMNEETIPRKLRKIDSSKIFSKPKSCEAYPKLSDKSHSRKRKKFTQELGQHACFRGKHVCCLHGYIDRGTQTDITMDMNIGSWQIWEQDSGSDDDQKDETDRDKTVDPKVKMSDSDARTSKTTFNTFDKSKTTSVNCDDSINSFKSINIDNIQVRSKLCSSTMVTNKTTYKSGNNKTNECTNNECSKDDLSDKSQKELNSDLTDTNKYEEPQKGDFNNKSIKDLHKAEYDDKSLKEHYKADSDYKSHKHSGKDDSGHRHPIEDDLNHSDHDSGRKNNNKEARSKDDIDHKTDKGFNENILGHRSDEKSKEFLKEWTKNEMSVKIFFVLETRNTGVLHKRKFVCPGLHCPCILSEGDWITPKQFSIMGGKASLKNWKNAIRVRGINIRTLMDSGALDFVNHQTDCSGKCSHKSVGGPGKYQSKINSLERKQIGTVQQFNQALGGSPSISARSTPNASHLDESEDMPPFVPFVQNLSTHSPGFDVLRQAQGEEYEGDSRAVFPSPIIKCEKPDDGEYGGENYGELPVLNPVLTIASPMVTSTPILNSNVLIDIKKENSAVPMVVRNHNNNTPVITGSRSKQSLHSQSSSSPAVSYLVQNGQVQGPVMQVGQHYVLQKDMGPPPPDILKVASAFPDIDSIMKDSATFWSGIKDIGLLDEVFNDIKCSLRSVRHEMNNFKLSKENADKVSSIINILGLQTKLKYKLANQKVASEKQNLKLQEEIEELKRKVEVTERKQEELKRKSDCFDKLLAKRPRHEPEYTIVSEQNGETNKLATVSDNESTATDVEDGETVVTDSQLDESFSADVEKS